MGNKSKTRKHHMQKTKSNKLRHKVKSCHLKSCSSRKYKSVYGMCGSGHIRNPRPLFLI
jgi:hypothetical protein